MSDERYYLTRRDRDLLADMSQWWQHSRNGMFRERARQLYPVCRPLLSAFTNFTVLHSCSGSTLEDHQFTYNDPGSIAWADRVGTAGSTGTIENVADSTAGQTYGSPSLRILRGGVWRFRWQWEVGASFSTAFTVAYSTEATSTAGDPSHAHDYHQLSRIPRVNCQGDFTTRTTTASTFEGNQFLRSDIEGYVGYGDLPTARDAMERIYELAEGEEIRFPVFVTDIPYPLSVLDEDQVVTIYAVPTELQAEYLGPVPSTGSSPFDPTDYGTPISDLDANDEAQFVVSEAGNVTSWTDPVSALVFAQGEDAAAIVRETRVQGRKAAVHFSGGVAALTAGAALFTGAGPRTLVVVYRPETDTGSIFGQAPDAGGNNSGLSLYTMPVPSPPNGTQGDPSMSDGVTGGWYSERTPTTDWGVVVWTYDGTHGKLRRNGVLLTEGDFALDTDASPATIGGDFGIGAALTGHVGQLIGYAECLSDASVAALSARLMTRWGIA